MLVFEVRNERAGGDVCDEEAEEENETGFASAAGHLLSKVLSGRGAESETNDFIIMFCFIIHFSNKNPYF